MGPPGQSATSLVASQAYPVLSMAGRIPIRDGLKPWPEEVLRASGFGHDTLSAVMAPSTGARSDPVMLRLRTASLHTTDAHKRLDAVRP